MEAANKLLNKDIATRIINASYGIRLTAIPLATDNPEVLDCVDMVTQFRIMVGANKDHTPLQLQIEAKYLQNSFSHLTVDDYNLAIELFLNNKLDIDLPAYVTFSPLFMSHVFNAYLRYWKKTIKEINILSEQKLLILDVNMDKTRLQGMKDCVRECYKHAGAKFEERFFNSIVYDMLRKSKRLILTPELITKGKKYGEKKFLEDRTANKERDKIKQDAKQIGDEFKYANPARLYDRKKAEQEYAKDYFLMNYFENNDIDEIIESITIADLSKVQ